MSDKGRNKTLENGGVMLDDGLITQLRQVCSKSPVVKTFVNLMVMMAISGITIKIWYGNRELKPRDRMQYYIDKVFFPFALKQARACYEIGLMVYSRVPWEEDERIGKPTIPRDGHYQIGMDWKKDERKYSIYRRETTKGAKSVYDQKPSRDAWVVEVYPWEPKDDGSLQSPYATILPMLLDYQKLWEWYVNSVPHFSKPLLVFGGTSSSNTPITGDPLDTSRQLPGDITQLHMFHYSKLNDERRKQYEVAHAAKTMREQGVTLVYNGVTQKTELVSSSSLTENTYINPINETLQNTVTPTPIPNFKEAVTDLRAMILEELLTPSGSKFQEHSGVSATAELSLRQVNDRVKQLQDILARPLEKIMEHMLEDVFTSSLSNVYFQMEEVRESPLSSKEKKKIVKQQFRVHLTFDYTPLTTYEALKRLYDDNHIDHETFGEYGLKMVGIPAAEQLSESDVMKQIRQKRKMNEESMPRTDATTTSTTTTATQAGSTAKKAKKEALSGGSESVLPKRRETPIQK